MTDFGEIIEFIEREMGIDTDSIGIISVASAISKHIRPDELENKNFATLMSDNSRIQDLINDLTVPETWFFRDTECFNFLKQSLSSDRFNYSYSNKLRILSAPSSTGEEPYSIAMLLMDLGFKLDEFEIVAVDINPISLNKAKLGIYGKSSFRNEFSGFKEKYFKRIENDQYELDYKIKSIPIFKKGNLAKRNFLSNEPRFDYIFCKNLLIYLNSEARNLVLQNINRLLKADGVLFAGLSETAYFTRNQFEHVKHDMAFACKQIIVAPNVEQSLFSNEPQIRTTKTRITKAVKAPVSVEIIEHKQSLSVNIEELYLRLKDLANSGSYSEAEQICIDILNKDNADYTALYVMGLIRNASGHTLEAKDYFHKVLYLKPDHYESLIHTSLIYESNGEHELANIFRERAERIFIKQSNQ